MFKDYQLRTQYFFQSLILRNHGHHATIQRLEILDTITQHKIIQKTALASQLVDQGVSHSTTYAAMKLFIKTGLVQEILLSHSVYLAATKFVDQSPFSFTCTGCSRNWIYKNKRLSQAARKHFKAKSHETMHITLTGTGLCNTCRTEDRRQSSLTEL